MAVEERGGSKEDEANKKGAQAVVCLFQLYPVFFSFWVGNTCYVKSRKVLYPKVRPGPGGRLKVKYLSMSLLSRIPLSPLH